MKNFDPTKPVQTANGYSARILAADLETEGGETIAAAVKCVKSGRELVRLYNSDGTSHFYYDLINIPLAKQSITCWAVIYPSTPLTGCPNLVDIHHTEALARRSSGEDAIAVIPIQIEFTEGQGL